MTIAAPAPGTVTMFTTSWCGYCTRLKAQMGRAGINYTRSTRGAPAERGLRHEGQRRQPDRSDAALPDDGSAATNPSINEVKSRLN